MDNIYKTHETHAPAESKFTGSPGELIVLTIGTGLLMLLTLGFFAPWAICKLFQWFANHTYIRGKQLAFTGRGSDLLLQYIKWILLSIGLFIILLLLFVRSPILALLGMFGYLYYAFWLSIQMIKWLVSKTHFAD